MKVRLDRFDNSTFDRGRPIWVEALWLLVQAIATASWIPGRWHRVALLRLFGARIGKGVIIRPRLRVKFPWRLEIGDFSWIGEEVWIDNLAPVRIGSHCCLSQGAYFCTGNHDWSRESFDLVLGPITVEDGAWVAAQATVGPGVTIGAGAVLAIGSVATSNLQADWIYSGIPAKPLRERVRMDVAVSA